MCFSFKCYLDLHSKTRTCWFCNGHMLTTMGCIYNKCRLKMFLLFHMYLWHLRANLHIGSYFIYISIHHLPYNLLNIIKYRNKTYLVLTSLPILLTCRYYSKPKRRRIFNYIHVAFNTRSIHWCELVGFVDRTIAGTVLDVLIVAAVAVALGWWWTGFAVAVVVIRSYDAALATTTNRSIAKSNRILWTHSNMMWSALLLIGLMMNRRLQENRECTRGIQYIKKYFRITLKNFQWNLNQIVA